MIDLLEKIDIEIRNATASDIKDIKKLLSFYYLDTEKTENCLGESVVAVLKEKIAGCACLDAEDIVELRSIAVLPWLRNRGIGIKLLKAILRIACDLSHEVYLRTASPDFFEKNGFRKLQKDMKKYIWKECAECGKFDICRQTSMMIEF